VGNRSVASVLVSDEYIAGVFDADGCLFLNRGKYPRAKIANTELSLLEVIRTSLGFGKIYRKGKPKPNHKQGYDLVFDSSLAQQFFKRVFEFVAHPEKKSKMQDMMK